MYLLKRMKNWRWWVALPWILVCVALSLLIAPFWLIAVGLERCSNLTYQIFDFLQDRLYKMLGVGNISNWVFEKEEEAAIRKAMEDL